MQSPPCSIRMERVVDNLEQNGSKFLEFKAMAAGTDLAIKGP
jgi:hypothetical protein